MNVCGMGIGVGLSFPEGSGINNYISGLILFNNLCSFKRELVYLENSFLSKMICVKWKMSFPCV